MRLSRWVLALVAALLLIVAGVLGPRLFTAGAQDARPVTPAPAPLAPVPPAAPTAPVLFTPAEDLNLAAGQTEDEDYGEELVYEIFWNGLPAGMANLRVRRRERFPPPQGPEVWAAKLEIRSSRAVSTFYRVRTKSTSIIDAKGGFTRFFFLERKEADYRYVERKDRYWAEERIKFDYTLGEMKALYETKRADLAWRSREIPLADRVLDPLAAIYYLRSRAVRLDLNDPPERAPVLPICTDRRVWNVRVLTLRREYRPLWSRGPVEPCLMLRFETQVGDKFVPGCGFSGPFERRGEMTLWLHEATRIPVGLDVETPIGPCEVRLASHQGAPF
ncbi:MAG: DUF3108 domain-containing protein [Planctomycetota bacterium]|nr:DUF3108 domain-containing protein [Planctomycetota bacterium]